MNPISVRDKRPEWIVNNQTIKSDFPPKTISKLMHQDNEIVCAPYKIARENDSDKKIIE